MKKIISIAGTLVLFSGILGLILWMNEDSKLTELAGQFKESKEKTPEKNFQNLEKLSTVKPEDFPKFENRLVLGETLKTLKTIPEKIMLINKADPNWDKKTISYLNDSSDYDRKSSIDKKFSLIRLNNEMGLYLEQASISFTQRDGTRGTFEALINSENGSIEMVFSKNINESLE